VGMLAPNGLVATGPRTPTAAAVRRVVVVLPFVPLMRATRRPADSLSSSRGSTSRPIRPPMTEPSPRPVARDAAAAIRDTTHASPARSGSLAVTRAAYRGRHSRSSAVAGLQQGGTPGDDLVHRQVVHMCEEDPDVSERVPQHG